ncbi:PEP-CTERM sorting domain-containing protein [Massilia atriviolacea]|nr:PEP-CTERM sorting domain-containing protein [Massilia atriviolacea]
MLLKSTLLALAFCAFASTAQADSIHTITGDTTGAAIFNRPLEDLSGLSGIGTDVSFNQFRFTVSAPGAYSFLTTAAFDSMVFLYSPSFDPGAALTNALIGNDDLLGTTTSGFVANLDAGTSYVLVITGYEGFEYGRHSTTIGGPGAVSVVAVPEPETYALLAFGLGVVGLASRRAKALKIA